MNFLIHNSSYVIFNLQFDKRDTKQLLQLLHSTGLSQRVCQLTHRQGHVLDWGITRESPVHLICSSDVEDLHLFDHFPRDSYYKHVKTKKAEKGGEVQKCPL